MTKNNIVYLADVREKIQKEKEESLKKLKEQLKPIDENIIACKQSIKDFKNFKKWYKPLHYCIYSEAEIQEWIFKYKRLLRFGVITKRFMINFYNKNNNAR